MTGISNKRGNKPHTPQTLTLDSDLDTLGDGDVLESLDDGEAMVSDSPALDLKRTASWMHTAVLSTVRHKLIALRCRDHVAPPRVIQGGREVGPGGITAPTPT